MSKILKSNFTFGFEFEGFGRLETYLKDSEVYNNYSDLDELECNSLEGDDISDYYENINYFINKTLLPKNVKVYGRTHYDGSVKNYLNGYQSFEYSSPVFKYSMKNLKLIKNFFSNLSLYDMGVNETCGFHTHISFNDITEKDAIWIVCQIAFNENWTKELCYFKYENNTPINFFQSRYANKDFLEEIKRMIISKDFKNLRYIINSDKYRVLRIHPQGTLEWRGPRNFLCLNKGIDYFIKKLSNIIGIFSNALEMKEINGMSKKEFFDNFNPYLITSKFNINNLELENNTFKTLVRNGCFGLIPEFNMCDIVVKNNIINNKVWKKIAKASEKNPKILCNDNIQSLYNVIFNSISSNTIKSFIEIAKKNNFVFSKKIAEYILANDSLFLPYLIDYLPNISFNDLAFYTDRAVFNNASEEDIKSFIKICLSKVSDDDLIDMSIILLNSTFRADLIIKEIETGRYKNIDSTRLFSKSITFKNSTISDSLKNFNSNLIELKNKGLISFSDTHYIYNKEEIVENMINSISDFNFNQSVIDTTPSYYIADSGISICNSTNNLNNVETQPLFVE